MKKGLQTTIEISDAHIKLMQSKQMRGRNVISACEIREIQQYTDDEIFKILTEVALSKNIQTDRLNLIIPRRNVILRQLKLPSQNPAEIRKMIALQLVSQIPYALEDVNYSYVVLDKDTKGYTNVVVIIIHRDITSRLFNIFNKLNMMPGKLTLSSFGLLEWLIFQEHRKKFDIEYPAMLINIDLTSSEICFCHNGQLYFSRNIDMGAKDLHTDNIVGLISQIELSLGVYKKESMGPEIKKVYILSTLTETLAFGSKLEQELKIPTRVLTSFENVLCQKNINLGSMKDQAGVALAVSLGMHLADQKRLLNLMPQEVHDTKNTSLRRRRWVKFILLFITAFFLVTLILGKEMYENMVYLDQVKEQIEEIQPKLKKVKEKKEFVEVLNNELVERIFVSDIIVDLFKIAPEEISFRSLNMDNKGNLTIQGYAQTGSSVNDFQRKLVRSTVFGDVNLQYATKRKVFNMDVTDFKIDFKLTQMEKE